ncbi:hypothetical protein JCM11251_000090 [Rhodosporidiobolus azoricus]
MPDVRLSWTAKFRHVSPADFQAAQVRHKQDKREGGELDERSAKRQRSRRKYAPEDFQTPFATPNEVKEWFEKYPALQKRNFYIVQNHYATTDHFDLRFQLDGETMSWAMPKTLHNPGAFQSRQVIETVPHAISYSLVEGAVASGRSTTGVWDIGTYTICDTKTTIKNRQQAYKKGLDDGDTTQEDDDGSVQSEDERQEDLFRDAYYRSAFLPVPAVEGRAGLPAKRDTGHVRGFVIELNGERYKGLRLNFNRMSNEYRTHLHCSDIRSLAATEVHPHILHPNRSLLTNRTMQEIREDSLRWLAELTGVAEGNGAGEEGDRTSDEEDERRIGKPALRALIGRGSGKRGKSTKSEGAQLAKRLETLLKQEDEGEIEMVAGEERLTDHAADVHLHGFRGYG